MNLPRFPATPLIGLVGLMGAMAVFVIAERAAGWRLVLAAGIVAIGAGFACLYWRRIDQIARR
jgi:hypothetical protein